MKQSAPRAFAALALTAISATAAMTEVPRR
jgi:hypothetical protein